MKSYEMRITWTSSGIAYVQAESAEEAEELILSGQFHDIYGEEVHGNYDAADSIREIE